MDITSVYEILTNKLQGWIESVISMLPNLTLGLLIAIIFFFIARIIRKFMLKGMNKYSSHEALNKMISNIISIMIFGVGVFIFLDLLKWDKALTSLVAGAGIIGLAISFAFQNLISNFTSGIMITLRKPYIIGDLIEAGDYMGKVQEIKLRSTEILTPDGKLVIIPNKNIYENAIVNYNKTPTLRIDLLVGISYGDDLQKVKDVVLNALQELEPRDQNHEIEFFYEEFGNSSINFIVRIWVPFKEQIDYFHPKSEAIMRIKKAFDENDITIPFPIRTLDFGIKGGEKLTEMEPKVHVLDGRNNGND